MTTVAIKPKSKSELFTEYLQENLSKSQYDTLYLRLGMTNTNRLTRMLNPDDNRLGDFSSGEVMILANLLRVSPEDLIMDWGLGVNNITLDQANQMVKNQGIEIGFVQHAA